MKQHDEKLPRLHEHLSDNHAHLNALFEQLVTRFRTGDPERIHEAFRNFETELETLMHAEEVLLLPAFALQANFEAQRVRADHEKIRKQLAQLNEELDLHSARLECVEQLLETLREHAAREERMLYPWAEANLTQREKTMLSRATLPRAAMQP